MAQSQKAHPKLDHPLNISEPELFSFFALSLAGFVHHSVENALLVSTKTSFDEQIFIRERVRKAQ
jgi:hypothetical protein